MSRIAVDYLCVDGVLKKEGEPDTECPHDEKIDGLRGEVPDCPTCGTPMKEVPGIGIKRWRHSDTGFDKL